MLYYTGITYITYNNNLTSGAHGLQDDLSSDEKKMMKKSIAENMIQSTHINGGITSGPQFGTIRHKPGIAPECSRIKKKKRGKHSIRVKT